MRPWHFILVFVILLATFDHIANDSDGIREVADWLVRSGRVTTRAIHALVMSFFGE
jgi:hypothetical protein